jgi:hypothetical protein
VLQFKVDEAGTIK